MYVISNLDPSNQLDDNCFCKLGHVQFNLYSQNILITRNQVTCVLPFFKIIISRYLFLDVEDPEPRTCVTIDEWIDVWGTIVGKCKNMDDLPMWLQYYPRTLFEIINRTGKFQNKVISTIKVNYFQ